MLKYIITFTTLTLSLFTFSQDLEPPVPTTADWEHVPTPAGQNSLAMKAIPSSDPSGVEYFFECLENDSFNSNWQEEPYFLIGSLTEGTNYTFRVKTRDQSLNQNEGNWSETSTAAPLLTNSGGFDYAWLSYDANDFGPKQIEFDYDGAVEISHAPAIGIHPRIYFGPDEIPAIQSNFQNTLSGQASWAVIHAHTTLLHLGSTYSHSELYAQDPDGNRLIDNVGYWNHHDAYYALVNEEPLALDGAVRHQLAELMAFEAFECLLTDQESDSDSGLDYSTRRTMLTAAMEHWANLVVDDEALSWNNWNFFGGINMALAYDLHFNNLSEEGKIVIRQCISSIVPDSPRYGSETESYATTSNWSTLNFFEVLTNLAIEGEEGYKSEMTEDWCKALRKFVNYGWYESGAPYEGLGKNELMVTGMIALAKRGYSLLGHPHVKAFGDNYLPQIMQPFGDAFIGHDVWGGTGRDSEIGGYKFNPGDAVGLKFAFPDNVSIDHVWRNYISKHHTIDSDGYVYRQVVSNGWYHNYLIPAAIFAKDYDIVDWEVRNQATLEGKSFIAPERGLVAFRSGFNKDALSVLFHCRQDLGGHTHGDRNDIVMSALGRIWIRKTYGNKFQRSYFHSIVMIDDKGIPLTNKDGVKARQPGRIVLFDDNNPFLSTVSGDATHAYSFEWHWEARPIGEDHSWLGNDGWEEVNLNWNDFRIVPGTEPYFSTNFYDYADWNQPNKVERMIMREVNLMEKVKRSVHLLRFNSPMVIVTDDIQKDNEIHNYKWKAQVANDLVIESTTISADDSDWKQDIILKEPDAIGNRRLLVRVLNADGLVGGEPGYLEELEYIDYFSGSTFSPNPPHFRQQLIIESESISPNFKILLFPFELGDSLPITSFNEEHDMLTISNGEETQTVEFIMNAEGLTTMELVNPPIGCPGDCNNDGVINIEDALVLTSNYGCQHPFQCNCDLTGDFEINILDLLEFLTVYGNTCD